MTLISPSPFLYGDLPQSNNRYWFRLKMSILRSYSSRNQECFFSWEWLMPLSTLSTTDLGFLSFSNFLGVQVWTRISCTTSLTQPVHLSNAQSNSNQVQPSWKKLFFFTYVCTYMHFRLASTSRCVISIAINSIVCLINLLLKCGGWTLAKAVEYTINEILSYK